MREGMDDGPLTFEGCILFVKTVRYPPFRRDGVNVLVEDRNGDCVHLKLNNFVHDTQTPEERLPVGTCLAVAEPCFVPGPLGLAVRCDNPEFAMPFRCDREWAAACAGQSADPTFRERDTRTVPSAEQEFAKGRFATSAALWTDALQEGPEGTEVPRHEMLCHRAECRMRMGQWRSAREDWEAALRLDSGSVQGRSGLAQALLMLQRPSDALPLLKELADERPGDMALVDRREAAVRALEEQRSGWYDFGCMRREVTEGKGDVSGVHMDFLSADVEVVQTASKGRGVRAKRPLCENQLIMASRAFAFKTHEAAHAGVRTGAFSWPIRLSLPLPHLPLFSVSVFFSILLDRDACMSE